MQRAYERFVPISDCEVRDPRIRRTRQLLQGALRNLMQSKKFDEISVQDITDAATVNRATFYDHYTDKFGLLEAMVAGGFHRLLEERRVHYDGTCASAAGAIILATCDYLTECHSSQSECQRQSSFEPLSESAITSAIRRVLIAGMPKAVTSAELSSEMIATTAAWAIYGAVKEWSRTPDRVPAEKMVPLILQLVIPVLNAAGPVQPEVLAPSAGS
jgi:AcrR family transcriptional regulator